MGLFSGISNMVDMVAATPALIESAQRLRDSTEAQQAQYANGGFGQGYVNTINTQQFGAPSAEALAPIAGVTIEQYCAVTKGIAAHGYDASKLELVASGLGISATNWAQAHEGWGARIQNDRALGSHFNVLYTAS